MNSPSIYKYNPNCTCWLHVTNREKDEEERWRQQQLQVALHTHHQSLLSKTHTGYQCNKQIKLCYFELMLNYIEVKTIPWETTLHKSLL